MRDFVNKPTICYTVKPVPGSVAHLVTCLATDAGVASSIPAQSHTFMEIDHSPTFS